MRYRVNNRTLTFTNGLFLDWEQSQFCSRIRGEEGKIFEGRVARTRYSRLYRSFACSLARLARILEQKRNCAQSRLLLNFSLFTMLVEGHLWRHKHASHFEKEEVQKKYTSDKSCCNFDGCDQVFDTQPELVEHVKSHVGTTDKACMCNECGATFVSQQNLAKHTRRRHLEPMNSPHKSHRCDKCDKAFFTSYQLVVHFR